ncbi:hypothetical protein BJ875DRAFT_182972 [Amylocarpus encephaloides]|uniref:Uncharacterized protein n=1 Tax=Amylocarpus encephaloides TaxID=45428 RepID=A0A9P7YA33_9HELO|nr:hypothetical protein BJ875DRAFT_182972 [Amylocarpus encephaloides]
MGAHAMEWREGNGNKRSLTGCDGICTKGIGILLLANPLRDAAQDTSSGSSRGPIFQGPRQWKPYLATRGMISRKHYYEGPSLSPVDCHLQRGGGRSPGGARPRLCVSHSTVGGSVAGREEAKCLLEREDVPRLDPPRPRRSSAPAARHRGPSIPWRSYHEPDCGEGSDGGASIQALGFSAACEGPTAYETLQIPIFFFVSPSRQRPQSLPARQAALVKKLFPETR